MILPVRDLVPKRTTGGLDTVGVRCPDNDATREIIRLAGVPIAAPSANTSGKPSTTTAAHVLHDMDGKIDAIVDGGPCRVGVESTIVDLTAPVPRLLRPGGIGPEALAGAGLRGAAAAGPAGNAARKAQAQGRRHGGHGHGLA